jgi:hypothetical protein
MPAQQSGSPMTIMWKVKLDLVFAISGRCPYPGEYRAFTLQALISVWTGGGASLGGHK